MGTRWSKDNRARVCRRYCEPWQKNGDWGSLRDDSFPFVSQDFGILGMFNILEGREKGWEMGRQGWGEEEREEGNGKNMRIREVETTLWRFYIVNSWNLDFIYEIK